MELTDFADDMAKEFAGNWSRPQGVDFLVGFEAPDRTDGSNWGIFYTSDRDTESFVTRANAESIREMLGPFTSGEDPDVVARTDSHWGVGYRTGWTVRVRKPDGAYTDAFMTLTEIHVALGSYPVLNDEKHSAMEFEYTLGVIKSHLGSEEDELVQALWDWLWEDEQGNQSYPSWDSSDVERALRALHPDRFEE